MKKLEQPDISELVAHCEKEPIERPGAIQPHGYLLVADRKDFLVKYVSKNWDNLLDTKPEDLLDKHLSEVWGGHFYRQLQAWLTELTHEPSKPLEFTTWKHRAKEFLVLCHVKDGMMFFEMEPFSPLQSQVSIRWVHRYQDVVAKVTLQQMLEESAQEIRRISGYDRVMIYRFYPDMHGEVVAEEKREDLEPFLGLHYPASDIPKQARTLYLTNWTRLLVNVNYAPVSLVANEASVHELDMSYCSLRSISPVHVRYLQNMGVSATLTISLINRGKLWGLVACHHYDAKFLSYRIRESCEMIGQILSLNLHEKEEEEVAKAISNRRESMLRVAQQVEERKNFLAGLTMGNELFKLFSNTAGVAIVFYGKLQPSGTCPTEEQLNEFIQWFEKSDHGGMYTSSNLEEEYPYYTSFPKEIKGLLLLKVYEHSPIYIFWFRKEFEHQVQWAGDPEKEVKVEGNVARLTPRDSFRQFLQTVEGQSDTWTAADIKLTKEFGYLLRDKLVELQQGQLRDTQALFRMLYEQSADALFLSDFHTEKIIDCNQRALDFFEVDRKEELIGISGIELHANDTEGSAQELALLKEKLLREGEASAEILYQSKKGRKFWGRLSTRILQGYTQKIFVAQVADISNSKQYESELKKHNEELSKVNKELDRFVYSASHDLRAPIASLQGLLQIAQDADNVKEMLSYLEMGKTSLNRLDHFIQEILDYSRNSRMEVAREEVLLNVIINGVLENYAYIEDYKHIRKEIEIKQDFAVYTDPFRLKVILNNLVSNALRYSRPEHREAYVKVYAHAKRDELTLIVEDNGQGIPEKHLSRIFDMFYRADNRKAGSGLGLYIVRETLSKLQGKIEVESEIDQGTTLRVRIPNAQVPDHMPEDDTLRT